MESRPGNKFPASLLLNLPAGHHRAQVSAPGSSIPAFYIYVLIMLNRPISQEIGASFKIKC